MSFFSDCQWKPNWDETKQHFIDWWKGEGMVLGMGGGPRADRPHLDLHAPEPPASIEQTYTGIDWRLRKVNYDLSRCAYLVDTMPIAETDLGPGSLATFLGSKPRFAPDTVWFDPCIQDVEDPETLPPLRFDPENRWWKFTETLMREMKKQAGKDYIVGCPDLVENLDILASLRESQTLLVDMIERPDWVGMKLREINQVWFEAYRRIYDIIKLSDGSSAYKVFSLWGPGKIAKVQCDMSAMFSPAMFEEIVVPALTEQCEWLDHSVYHLDGTQALCHLDALLQIEALDAIEWTPQAGIENGGSPRWYDLYRRILAAGKAVRTVGVTREEVVPLLDAVGGKGLYVSTHFRDERDAENLLAQVEPFR